MIRDTVGNYTRLLLEKEKKNTFVPDECFWVLFFVFLFLLLSEGEQTFANPEAFLVCSFFLSLSNVMSSLKTDFFSSLTFFFIDCIVCCYPFLLR